MLIENTQKQLKITLSAVEICDYFGSFSDIRYDNMHSRAALGKILKKAMDSTDFSLSSGRLSIKVFPTPSGGCDIYFILSSSNRLAMIKRPYIYEFHGCENMLSVCEQLKFLVHKDLRVSLFEKDGAYRIAFAPSCMCKKIMRICSEYMGRAVKGRYEAEKTREHWHTLCDNTPVSTIIV
ncbi:MAG: hypothetical protein IKL44_04875 [Clostridia bacterium]|nr:hypothetical protein [Clostridia bacterium]